MTFRKYLFLFFAIILVRQLSAEQWDNPSLKYSDVYKQYEGAQCPITQDNIRHFVYFSRDRENIIDHDFLNNKRFFGAQIMYSWRELEPEKDVYDFSKIVQDYTYLKTKNKKLYIQLQDATFSTKYKAVPVYLQANGSILQRNDAGIPEGWVAKRWNIRVQRRFAKLLMALGKEFDGKIEGINLQESAIGVTQKYDETFTPALYSKALKANMLALKKSFPQSVTMQYANFMPGEWLPWEDKGYLKSIYAYGNNIGVGLGAPDLMIKRKAQLNHTISMMHEHEYNVPLGIAVQDGNYIGQTNTLEKIQHRKNLVPVLHAFAQDFMKVDYMFWVDQKPYFKEDVLSCFTQ